MNVAVSVVMPCLDEEESVDSCVVQARKALDDAGLPGEILVVDNGSVDRSAERAREAGALVVEETRRGYGSAYLSGIAAAKGDVIVMGDADGTYDFGEIPRLVAALDSGLDLVLGSRFSGRMERGAMPRLHRYVGNPLLSWVLRVFFKVRVRDCHSGLRAVTRPALERITLRTLGMEFASEMIIEAARAGLRIGEIPIDYQLRRGDSKLRTFRDGWRHLRLLLMYSPTYLFLVPGLLALTVGLALMVALLPGPITVGPVPLDYHTLVAGSLLVLLGVQTISLGLSAKTFAWASGFDRRDPFMAAFVRIFSVERGVACGAVLLAAGLAVDAVIAVEWAHNGFRNISQLRPAIAALTLTVVGAETVFASFLLGILLLERRE